AQRGGSLRLAFESTDDLCSRRAHGCALANQLHGRRTDQETMLRTPDPAHPAAAQWFHEPVAAHREPFVEQLLVNFKNRALREDDRALEHGPKFTDVARPRL